MNNIKPEWLVSLEDGARRGMVAFRETGYPDAFIFIDTYNDSWYDWEPLFGDYPIYNLGNRIPRFYDEEECPLMPIWAGEETPQQISASREFRLRYVQSGDF